MIYKTASVITAIILISHISRAMQSGESQPIFNTSNAQILSQKLLQGGINVPFEVVGHRQLFADVLNNAASGQDAAGGEIGSVILTESDVNLLLHHPVYQWDNQSKIVDRVNQLIALAYQAACNRIVIEGKVDEIAWRKRYCRWLRYLTPGCVDMKGNISPYAQKK